MNFKNKYSLIQNDTGEIVDEFGPGDKLSVQRQDQIEYNAANVSNFNNDKIFVKIYNETIPLLVKYLTPSEIRLAIALTYHVSYKDCIIRESCNNNSKILNIKRISEIYEMNYDYVKKMMTSLKNKGVIAKHNVKDILPDYIGRTKVVYTLNPFLFFRGTDIKRTVYDYYNSYDWLKLLTTSSWINFEADEIERDPSLPNIKKT